MSTQAARLADHLRRTVDGPMWHGPPLAELLENVSHGDAAAHPIPGAHSIWELTLHATVWAGIAGERIAGLGREVSPEEDWPRPPAPSAAAWAAARRDLQRSHHALAATVAGLDDARLGDTVAGRDHSIVTTIHGVIEHSTYHGGQIALLKRALHAG